MDRKLVYYPEPILRQVGQKVTVFDDDMAKLAMEMREIMKANVGMGLAAQQAGDSRSLIIIEFPGDEENKEPAIPFTPIANPKITNYGKETSIVNEGCLSLPYFEVPVERANQVTLIGQDLKGNPLKIKAKGLLARIIQHEVDHSQGKLIIDYEDKTALIGKRARVAVWGSDKFTTDFINVIRQSVDIVLMITEPPKPSGRKGELTPTIAKRYADMLNIPTIEPEKLDDPRLYNYLLSIKLDLMLVASYGRLIPQNLFELPGHGTLNIHPSLLPKYRGATPVQSTILNGDTQTGVTIMKLAPRFDTGAIIAQADYDLIGDETYEELAYELAELGGEALKEILPEYLKGNLQAVEQSREGVINVSKITEQTRWLNPKDSPTVNERKVRAFSPKPSAFAYINDRRVKVIKAHLENDHLIFDVVQPEGKKPMPWEDFKRGFHGEMAFTNLPD